MRDVETGDSDVLEWRGGGGCLMLFGFPFLAAGILVMVMPHLKPPEGDAPPWVFFALFGLVFGVVGGGLMSRRRGVVIDRRERRAESWWGLIVPFRRKTYRLEAFGGVELAREIRRSKNSTYTVYPVRLKGGSEKLSIGETRDYLRSRGKAEKLAKFLGLPLEDSSSGEAVVRQAAELDESLRDRIRRTGASLEVPAPPAEMRTQVSLEGEATVLEIPGAGLALQTLVLLIVGLFFVPIVIGLVVFLLELVGRGDRGFPFLIAVGIVILVVTVLLVRFVIRRGMRRERVIVRPGSISLEPRGIEIPAEELEELERRSAPANLPAILRGLAPGVGIIARSDKAEIRFGGHLPEDELRHLHGLIKSILAS